jgi:glycosyltransferase involved in cell wall biosynthesis
MEYARKRYGNSKPSVFMKFNRTVLQVIPALDAGGAERTTVEITRAIVSAGGRSIVATEGGRLESEIEDVGGKIIRMPVASKNPAMILANVYRLRRAIASHGVDIIHARSRAPGWSAFMAARTAGIAYAATVHGAYGARTALKRLYNSSLTRADLVIANSAYTAATVRRVYKVADSRLAVIPRGADLTRFDPSAVNRDKISGLRADWGIDQASACLTLLLPARLTDWKGHQTAIDALTMLHDIKAADGPAASGNPVSFRLVFAGDAQGRDEFVAMLKRKVDESGVRHMVKFVGHCTDMPTAYALADIVLAPSTRDEAFGRTAVEAGAIGRVVIASDAGGFRETIVDGETGLLAKPGDARAVAHAIASAASMTSSDRAAMGDRARKRIIRYFSTDAMCEATLSAYERALRGAPQPGAAAFQTASGVE